MNELLADFLTLFTTIDPIGTLIVFIGVAAKRSPEERARIAFRSIGCSALILIGFIIIGQIFLSSIGVQLASFQLSGGIIFFLVGLKMVFDSGVASQESAEEAGRDIAIFPLAVPSIASPGSILAAMTLTDNREYSVPEQIITTVMLLAVLGITLIVLLQAGRIYAVLGSAGSNLSVRVMGMILAGIATETIVVALRELFPVLG